MSLLEIFKLKAKNKNANIGIGLGELKDHNIKILHSSLEFLKEIKSTIYLLKSLAKLNN